jgi:hypothetical protein
MSLPAPAQMSTRGLIGLIFIVATLGHLFWRGVGWIVSLIISAAT